MISPSLLLPFCYISDIRGGILPCNPVTYSDTLDWKSQNKSKIVKHIEKSVGKHQVILLHDVFGTSVDAALTAIDTLIKQGYTFVTVDELLID